MLAHPTTAVDRFNAQASHNKWPTLCDATLRFDSERLAALLDIWQSVRGARALPMRTDFSARALAKHLRDITFVDRIEAPGRRRRYRFRLFGSALARFTGDWTGRFLDEVVPEAFLASWLASYDATIEMGVPLRFTARFRADLDHIVAENFMAPLGDESGAATGLLVSVNYAPVVV